MRSGVAFPLGFALAVAVCTGLLGARFLNAQDDRPVVPAGDYRYYEVSVPAPASPLQLLREPALTSEPSATFSDRPRIIV
jgi:hypothetical protein